MSMPGDALSDVLKMVHLKACIYFVRDMPAPWGMDIPAAANGPLHMVLNGECVVISGGKEISLRAGDAILLPHGGRHQMLDRPSTVPEPGPEMLHCLMENDDLEIPDCATRMLCGHFEWDSAFDHPFFRQLPELIVVRGVFGRPDSGRFRAIIDLISAEKSDGHPGSSAVADRMGEVLFVCLLRSWMIDQNTARGVLATINDPRLSRALRYIHQNPERDLDLNLLATVAGMSRTSFAVHFREVMGTPPATYLAEWRMLTARRLLLQTELATSDIVSRVGYGSDAAFSRAFKRRFGETPGRVRRTRATSAPSHQSEPDAFPARQVAELTEEGKPLTE